jgi:hypothetical protein
VDKARGVNNQETRTMSTLAQPFRGTVTYRTWKRRGSMGRRVTVGGYRYDFKLNGQRERRQEEGWTAEQAREAMRARQREIAAGQLTPAPS